MKLLGRDIDAAGLLRAARERLEARGIREDAPPLDEEPEPVLEPLSFLARFAVRIDAPVSAGEEHVVLGWPIERDGRKHHAGSAVFSAAGEPLAIARALMIEARPA